MSRVLKFRAWTRAGEWNDEDEQEFIMIDAHDLAFEEYAPLWEQLQDSDDHCYFMQFTGLLDKNGVEIYEGDVCKYRNGNEYSIGEVRYLSARYVLITSLGYHGFTTSDIEILGNIHQHSELLKDKS